MARPSLGPAYGNTDRSTPARLLGGIPDASSQAPIGTNEIAAPALQAVQRIVDTFSAPGQGPTLGGALQITNPPNPARAQSPVVSQLARPMASPNPVVQQSIVNQPQYAPYVDNIGALSKSLAGFSTFFDSLNETLQKKDRMDDAVAKQTGSALARDAAQAGVFDSLQGLQKHLEKGVTEGAAGYGDMLRRVQAADPRALRYATMGMQDAYIKANAATLKERVAQTKTLLDGRPVESVPASDPEYQRMVTALMFPNGTMGILPDVFESNRQQLGAIYGSVAADQEKRFGGYKTQKAKEGLTAVKDGNAMSLVNGALPLEQIAANLTNGLDGFYSQSGQTNEEYQKELKEFPKGLVRSVLSASQGDWGKAKLALSRVPEVLAQVRVGPASAGDKRPLLLDQIGGMEGLYEITKDLQEQVIAQQNLGDQLEGREAKEQVLADIKAAFTPEVLADPAAIDSTENALLARGRQLYASNPDMALAYEEAVKKQTSSIRAGYVQPDQEKAEVNLWAEMATNPGVDFTERILQLQQSQQISYSAAKSFLATQAGRNREDNKANYQVLRGLQDDLRKRLEAQYARGGSEGGANLTPNEAREMWTMLGQLYKSGDQLIRKNPGADATQQLGDLYGNALSKALPQQVMTPPASATPENIARGLAGGSRGDAAQNAQLRRQAETQPLYTKERMGQQLDGILTGKPLDDATRQIIRRSGMKPSAFFSRQMQLHGMPLDPETQKRLQELDGGDLVSQAPTGTGGLGMLPTNRYLPVAQKMGLQFANTLLNAFVPPAAAAERGITPFTGSAMRGSTSLLGVIRDLRGANQFRGVSLVQNKRPGDYQSNPAENWFFDFRPGVVPKAIARAQKLSEQDINALAFTSLTEAGPTARGKLEVAANLINRSAIAGNKPIVDIAKAPGQYEGVFGYSRAQVVSAAEGRRIFGRRYDQVRKLILQGL